MRLLSFCLAVTVTAGSAVANGGAQVAPGRQPAPGSIARTFFPIVSAQLPAFNPGSVRLYMDGTDVSPALSVSGTRIQYVPQHRVAAGWHDVFVRWRDARHREHSDAWVFQTFAPDDPSDTVPIGNGYQLIPAGNWNEPGTFVHFFLFAPDDGFAVLQLCGLGSFPFEHQPFSPVFYVTVLVPVTPASLFLNCPLVALFTPTYAASPFVIPYVGSQRPSPAYGVVPTYRSTQPTYRVGPPVYRAAPTVYRAAMPTYRGTQPFYPPPLQRAPVGRGAPMPRSGAPIRISVPAVPHANIPHR